MSPATLCLTVRPLDGGRTAGVPEHSAPVPDAEGHSVAIRRAAEPLEPIRAGNLRVRFTPTPLTLHVETTAG